MQLLREHHDAEWELLPVRQLREHERVLVGSALALATNVSPGLGI
jgi:hypothetical protein